MRVFMDPPVVPIEVVLMLFWILSPATAPPIPRARATSRPPVDDARGRPDPGPAEWAAPSARRHSSIRRRSASRDGQFLLIYCHRSIKRP